MLFNRFLAVRFKDADMVIGGCQLLNGTHLTIPQAIEVDCQHTTESTPNEATIRLFNVAPETQRRLFVEGKKVEVEAGYWPQDGARDTGIIFKGQIRSVSTSVENGVDVVSELKFGDSDDAARVRRTRRTFPRGTTHRQVVDAIAADMARDGVSLGQITLPHYVEPRPLTVDRSAWRELDDICYQHGSIWSIQDGELNIYPADRPLRNSPVVLTPQTGVLDAPEFTHDGVKLRTMMLHYLRPGFTFSLNNTAVTNRAPGRYRIEEINFSGGNFGDEFGASITAKVMGADGRVRRSRDRTAGRRP